MAYATDSSAAPRGNVIHLTGDSFFGGGYGGFVLGDDPQGAFNPNDVPLDTANSRVGMWIKNNNTSSPPNNVVDVQFLVERSDSSRLWMNFYTMTGTDSEGNYYIGSSYNNGAWHYLEFDLAARLQQFGSAPTFVKLHLITVVGGMLDVHVDDIIVGQEILGKAYQLVPGAAAGGVVAAQSGTIGGIGISAWGTWYYHLNELGTMIAATKADGSKHGVYVPDHFGNYRYINGQRPNYLGLDGKFLDVANGSIYNFGARWYDPERGRWLSREPLGLDGPNLYHFGYNDPVNTFDIGGHLAVGTLVGVGLGAYSGYVGAYDASGGSLVWAFIGGTGGALIGGLTGFCDPTDGLLTASVFGGVANTFANVTGQVIGNAAQHGGNLEQWEYDYGQMAGSFVGGVVSPLTQELAAQKLWELGARESLAEAGSIFAGTVPGIVGEKIGSACRRQ